MANIPPLGSPIFMEFKDYFIQTEWEDFQALVNNSERRQFLQLKCKRHFAFLVYILGYRDLGEFHKDEINEIGKIRLVDVDGYYRRLWLWARGHFKTTIITVAHSVYLIINNPNIRILLVSYTLEVAKKIFKELKEHFMFTKDFIDIFPEFCPKANMDGKLEFGTTENFVIPNGRPRIAPTVMVAGVGTNLTGLHFDYMKGDDLVTRDGVTNDTQIQASKDYYSSLRQLFNKPTQPKEDVVGTTYHFNDLYSLLLKQKDFRKSVIPAKKEDVITFPERFSREGLDKILSDPTVGPYEFNAQYMLNPINPAEAKFREEWLKEYDNLPEELVEYILVDPASTQKKKSDYTVIERWGIDWEGKAFLIDGVRDKLTVFQRMDKIVEMIKKCKNLHTVKYEVLGGRHGDLETLQQRCLQEDLPIVPKETKSSTASKKDRIEQRLVGRYHAGMVFIPKSIIHKSEFDGKTYDFVTDLRLEFLQFPFSEHDDILDCQSQLFEEPHMIVKGKKPQSVKENKWGTADDWDRFYDSIDSQHNLNPFLTREQIHNRMKVTRFKNILNRL